MDRLYQNLFSEHLAQHRQMVFVMGPRQVGKTTVAQKLVEIWDKGFYLIGIILTIGISSLLGQIQLYRRWISNYFLPVNH